MFDEAKTIELFQEEYPADRVLTARKEETEQRLQAIDFIQKQQEALMADVVELLKLLDWPEAIGARIPYGVSYDVADQTPFPGADPSQPVIHFTTNIQLYKDSPKELHDLFDGLSSWSESNTVDAWSTTLEETQHIIIQRGNARLQVNMSRYLSDDDIQTMIQLGKLQTEVTPASVRTYISCQL